MFICTFSISSLQCHSLSADIVCYAFFSEFQQATDSYVAMGGLGQMPPPQKHLFVATHNSNSYKYTEIGDISQLSRIADVSYGLRSCSRSGQLYRPVETSLFRPRLSLS